MSKSDRARIKNRTLCRRNLAVGPEPISWLVAGAPGGSSDDLKDAPRGDDQPFPGVSHFSSPWWRRSTLVWDRPGFVLRCKHRPLGDRDPPSV